MYLTILKKDLKRKKTMNLILLIFIILAATFIAGSANNMRSVLTALDTYFEKANVPDIWVCTVDSKEADHVERIVDEEEGAVLRQDMLQLSAEDVTANGKKIDYGQTIVISNIRDTITIFTKEDKPIQEVKEGEIYASSILFPSFHVGDQIKIRNGNKAKTFTLKGSTKDVLFGSGMIGMSRFVVNEKDYKALLGEDNFILYSLLVNTEHKDTIRERLFEENVNPIFNEDITVIKLMYIMDMVTAAVMLIVSVCLILISMLILRFTIQFTMSEEFREIGVMKAIGMKDHKIRGLYIIKYLAVSVVGGVIGLMLSIPFSELMLERLSLNIIISNESNYWINIACVVGVVGIVLLFCYVCTGRIKKISPISAIWNGENGERYKRKGFIQLNRTPLPLIPFMAINDIISGFRRFLGMIIIFTLGILLLIIPVNTINTLQSDHISSLFSMAPSDHVINKEHLINNGNDSRNKIENDLKNIKKKLADKDIPANIFMELLFRMSISHGEKKCSSMAFQGMGEVKTDMYTYLEGTAPQNIHEVGISHIIADKIGVNIGDKVTINIGNEDREYIVTALYQTMNNLGEGIRFYQEEQLDYSLSSGSFGIQVLYTDNPEKGVLGERKDVLQKMFPGNDIHTAGSYVNQLMGDTAGQIESIKQLILIVVISINMLVTLLMVKSFITKEKGEIAMLKAIGFRNSRLILWQTLRISIVLMAAALIGILISTPLSQISSGQVFQMMGAASVKFDVVPQEVYVIYPLIILIATSLAGLLASLQLRKISASEIVNVE